MIPRAVAEVIFDEMGHNIKMTSLNQNVFIQGAKFKLYLYVIETIVSNITQSNTISKII